MEPAQNFVDIGSRARGAFLIPSSLAAQYPERNHLSRGGYGVVFGLEGAKLRKDLAVKKFIDPFESVGKAKKCFRELQLIGNLNHKNIVKFKSMYITGINPGESFSVYLITEYAGPDLRMWLQKETDEGRVFTIRDIKRLISELLRALKYLNSAKAIHRDIKPDNMAIGFDTGKLTLLDFGFARAFDKGNPLTSNPGTSYYRSIETVDKFENVDGRPSNRTKYDEQADMWSVGAILCEMFTDKILFKKEPPFEYSTKENPVLNAVEICGPIPECVLKKIQNMACQNYLREKSKLIENDKTKRGVRLRIDFMEYFQQYARPWHKEAIANEAAALLNFINRTLEWNPRKRLSVDAALRHPFLAAARVTREEVVAPHTIQDEADRPLEQWQQRIYEFIHTPRPNDRVKRKVIAGVKAKKEKSRKEKAKKSSKESTKKPTRKSPRRNGKQ